MWRVDPNPSDVWTPPSPSHYSWVKSRGPPTVLERGLTVTEFPFRSDSECTVKTQEILVSPFRSSRVSGLVYGGGGSSDGPGRAGALRMRGDSTGRESKETVGEGSVSNNRDVVEFFLISCSHWEPSPFHLCTTFSNESVVTILPNSCLWYTPHSGLGECERSGETESRWDNRGTGSLVHRF